MNSTQLLKNLFDHMFWADAEVWNIIFDNNHKVEKDEKIKELIYHIHLVQFAFLGIWNNVKVEYPKIDEFESLKSISDWGRNNYKNIMNYISNIDENNISNTADIPWSKYVEKQIGKKPENISTFNTMLQVCLHSTYHRWQLNIRLREFDCAPPKVDYIIWLWSGKPESKWPE